MATNREVIRLCTSLHTKVALIEWSFYRGLADGFSKKKQELTRETDGGVSRTSKELPIKKERKQ